MQCPQIKRNVKYMSPQDQLTANMLDKLAGRVADAVLKVMAIRESESGPPAAARPANASASAPLSSPSAILANRRSGAGGKKAVGGFKADPHPSPPSKGEERKPRPQSADRRRERRELGAAGGSPVLTPGRRATGLGDASGGQRSIAGGAQPQPQPQLRAPGPEGRAEVSVWATDLGQGSALRGRPVSADDMLALGRSLNAAWPSYAPGTPRAPAGRRSPENDKEGVRTGSVSLPSSPALGMPRSNPQPPSLAGVGPVPAAERPGGLQRPSSLFVGDPLLVGGLVGKGRIGAGREEELAEQQLLLSRRAEWLRWAKQCATGETATGRSQDGGPRSPDGGGFVWPGGAVAPMGPPPSAVPDIWSCRRGPW
jgi:hypothetical protein